MRAPSQAGLTPEPRQGPEQGPGWGLEQGLGRGLGLGLGLGGGVGRTQGGGGRGEDAAGDAGVREAGEDDVPVRVHAPGCAVGDGRAVCAGCVDGGRVRACGTFYALS